MVGFISCGGNASLLDYKAPKVIIDRDLNYPLDAQIEKIEGSALVGVFVSDLGFAQETRIVRSSGNAMLDSAAIEYAKSVKYTPASLKGKPVSSWTHLELRYKLHKVEFEHRVWLHDVEDLKSKIAQEDSQYQNNIYLQRLFMKYIALAQWDNPSRRHDKKYIIRMALDKEARSEWQDVLAEIVASFTLFDEFYEIYPECEFRAQVKETLIQQIVAAKFLIREKAQNSSRFMPKALIMLDQLDNRLKELLEKDQLPPT